MSEPDPPPTMDYYTPPMVAIQTDRPPFWERNDPRKPMTAVFWSLAMVFPALVVTAAADSGVVFVLYLCLASTWVIAALVLPKPRWFTRRWLSRRHFWLRIARIVLWAWIIGSGLWTWWLHAHNAPVRLWWHPWIDLAPALQLFGIGLLALYALAVADLTDGVRRRRRDGNLPS